MVPNEKVSKFDFRKIFFFKEDTNIFDEGDHLGSVRIIQSCETIWHLLADERTIHGTWYDSYFL